MSYPTRGELVTFQSLRKAGRLSFFRTAACRRCGEEIPREHTYCTQACEGKSMVWDSLKSLVGKQISIETTDGCLRNGVLSGITWASVLVSGEPVKYPAGLRLDAEPGDELPWIRIRWVRLRAEAEG